jgi:hypothetical protein
MKTMAVIRYPFCVLLSSIAWCGFLANILSYAWFLHYRLLSGTSSPSMRLPHITADVWGGNLPWQWAWWIDPLQLAFLYAAVAAIAWHFRKKPI